MYVSRLVCHTRVRVPTEVREGVASPGVGVTDGYEPPCGYRELSPGPLQEQSVLSTAQSSLQPWLLILRFFILSIILWVSSQVFHPLIFFSQKLRDGNYRHGEKEGLAWRYFPGSLILLAYHSLLTTNPPAPHGQNPWCDLGAVHGFGALPSRWSKHFYFASFKGLQSVVVLLC